MRPGETTNPEYKETHPNPRARKQPRAGEEGDVASSSTQGLLREASLLPEPSVELLIDEAHEASTPDPPQHVQSQLQ